MKITALKVSAVNIPTIKSYHVATLGTISSTQSVVIELHTDEGLIGIGETDPALMFTGESQQTVMTMLKYHLGPAVLGSDPLRIEAINQRMDQVCLGNPFAKAAIDLACHDLLGKTLEVPVYQLLGGMVHERIPVMWSLGSEPPEENAREALEKVQQGYTTIGLKLGVLPPEEDLQRVARVREVVGDDVQLRCDANQGWSVSTAIDTIQRLADYRISMIEQPIPKDDLKGLAQVRQAVGIPVGVDESLSSPGDTLKIIQSGAADFYSVKTTKQGGLNRSKRIAALVEAAGGQIFVNSMIEMGISVMSGLHFAVSTPGLFNIGHALNSVRRLADDILATPVQYDGGYIIAPQNCSGLGVELAPDKMQKYSVAEFWVKP